MNVSMHWGVRVPLRDGLHLSAILYLPEERSSASPVVFALTPYVAQTHHQRAIYFASRGLPFLSVDARGRGNSPGGFDPRNDARDGYDVVEWLARQPFCNGKVAMAGASYLGYSQWAVAGERPAHLETIIPVAAACFGIDFPMRNNVFMPYAVRWLTYVAGCTSQEKILFDWPLWQELFRKYFEAGSAFEQLDTLAGMPSPLFQEWLAHPQLDEYWDAYSPSPEQYSALSIPVLTITGAYDADQPGALEHYRRHMRAVSREVQARHYLVIGPWDHAGCAVPSQEFCGLKMGPGSLVDLGALHLQWYAWVMQGGPRPDLLRNNVTYYVAGADVWRHAESLEAITASTKTLYLHSTGNPVDMFAPGSLRAEPSAAGGPDQYVHDPRDTRLAELETTLDPTDLTDQRLIHANAGRQLVYVSAPFGEDTEVSGFFQLSVWLAIDQSDTDLCALVCEICSDGGMVRLATDWLRARYRESPRHAQLVHTAAPLRYDFRQFTFTSRRIPRGSRLCVVLGPLHSLHWQKNYGSGGLVARETAADARVVTVRLLHDAAHPSALYVPIGQSGQPHT
jgi:uncharacterized protein